MKPDVRDHINFLEGISDGIAKVEQFIHGVIFKCERHTAD